MLKGLDPQAKTTFEKTIASIYIHNKDEIRKDFAHDIYAESDFQKKNKQIEDTYRELIKKKTYCTT